MNNITGHYRTYSLQYIELGNKYSDFSTFGFYRVLINIAPTLSNVREVDASLEYLKASEIAVHVL